MLRFRLLLNTVKAQLESVGSPAAHFMVSRRSRGLQVAVDRERADLAMESAVELRPAPKARSAAHPQERSLIAGVGSTLFPQTGTARLRLVFYGLARASAQVSSASRAGHSSCPQSVRPYSTFGGT